MERKLTSHLAYQLHFSSSCMVEGDPGDVGLGINKGPAWPSQDEALSHFSLKRVYEQVIHQGVLGRAKLSPVSESISLPWI